MALWDEREGVPALPEDLLLAAKSSREDQPRSLRHTSTAPPSSTPVVMKPAAEDPLQMLARSRRPNVEAEEHRGDERRDVEAEACVAQLARAETLEKFVVDQLPTRATSEQKLVVEAEQATEGALGQRLGRLQAKIVAREEIGSVTWYTIKVRYDGIEKDCRKRYNDFVQFDKYLRTWFPCLKDMLPEIPSSGRVGLRHKLDLGTFNHRRQAGLERFLEIAVQTAGEQPVRRFLLNTTASDNIAPEHPADAGKDSATEHKQSDSSQDLSAKVAAARGGC